DYPEIAARGTPPRRRGGPRLEGRLDRGVRNTPASAGRTSRTLSAPRRPAEHPRVGGEDETTYQASRGGYGTPPRRRGGRRRSAVRGRGRRNTPASAGRTVTGRKSPLSIAEHPRVGGEDADKVGSLLTGLGTPPRRRGGRRHGSDPGVGL